MLGPLDRSRRDSSLFQSTTKQLRDFIDPTTCSFRLTSDWTSPSWWLLLEERSTRRLREATRDEPGGRTRLIGPLLLGATNACTAYESTSLLRRTFPVHGRDVGAFLPLDRGEYLPRILGVTDAGTGLRMRLPSDNRAIQYPPAYRVSGPAPTPDLSQSPAMTTRSKRPYSGEFRKIPYDQRDVD